MFLPLVANKLTSVYAKFPSFDQMAVTRSTVETRSADVINEQKDTTAIREHVMKSSISEPWKEDKEVLHASRLIFTIVSASYLHHQDSPLCLQRSSMMKISLNGHSPNAVM
jgi:hypothetical protein